MTPNTYSPTAPPPTGTANNVNQEDDQSPFPTQHTSEAPYMLPQLPPPAPSNQFYPPPQQAQRYGSFHGEPPAPAPYISPGPPPPAPATNLHDRREFPTMRQGHYEDPRPNNYFCTPPNPRGTPTTAQRCASFHEEPPALVMVRVTPREGNRCGSFSEEKGGWRTRHPKLVSFLRLFGCIRASGKG